MTAGLAVAAVIPVTQCGQTLDARGGNYALTGNLNCGCETITISANKIHFNTAGFTVTSTCNVVALSDGISEVTIDGGGGLSGGGGIAIGADRHIEVTNISVSGDGDLGGNTDGIQLSGAKDVVVNKCTIGGVFGITGTVDNGTFTNNTIDVGTLAPSGGVVVTGRNNLVKNNTITYGPDGATNTNVGIGVSDNNRVANNTVDQFNIGIEFSGDSNVVTNNTVTGTGPSQPHPSMDGIEAETGAKRNRITKNPVSGNVDDMFESNGPPCVNTWRDNTFSTSGGATACIH
jgi:parallel beta-helix repeat protein